MAAKIAKPNQTNKAGRPFISIFIHDDARGQTPPIVIRPKRKPNPLPLIT